MRHEPFLIPSIILQKVTPIPSRTNPCQPSNYNNKKELKNQSERENFNIKIKTDRYLYPFIYINIYLFPSQSWKILISIAPTTKTKNNLKRERRVTMSIPSDIIVGFMFILSIPTIEKRGKLARNISRLFLSFEPPTTIINEPHASPALFFFFKIFEIKQL